MTDDRIIAAYVFGAPPTYPPAYADAVDRLRREVERIAEKVLATEGTVLVVTREAELVERLLRARLEIAGRDDAMGRVNFMPPSDDLTVPVEDQVPDRPALTGIPADPDDVNPDGFDQFAPAEDPIPARVEPALTATFVTVGVSAGMLVSGLIVLAGAPLSLTLPEVALVGVAGGLLGRVLLAVGDAVRRRTR